MKPAQETTDPVVSRRLGEGEVVELSYEQLYEIGQACGVSSATVEAVIAALRAKGGVAEPTLKSQLGDLITKAWLLLTEYKPKTFAARVHLTDAINLLTLDAERTQVVPPTGATLALPEPLKTSNDAPCEMDHNEASAWSSGYESGWYEALHSALAKSGTWQYQRRPSGERRYPMTTTPAAAPTMEPSDEQIQNLANAWNITSYYKTGVVSFVREVLSLATPPTEQASRAAQPTEREAFDCFVSDTFAREDHVSIHAAWLAWQWRAALAAGIPAPAQSDPQAESADALKAEIARLNQIINTPHADEFWKAASIEAEHQRQRWGAAGDAGKTPADWFWLVGYLAGKALHAHAAGNNEKAEHHIITTAAACANWHRAVFGLTDMRPGHEAGIAGDDTTLAKGQS